MIHARLGLAVTTLDDNTNTCVQHSIEYHAASLQAALAEGDWANASLLIARINDVRNQALYDEVRQVDAGIAQRHSGFAD